MKLAAVTMVYNEAVLLPIWLRHYSAAVGAAHCYVIDHGSEDGSTQALGGASRVLLPRSPQDDERRAVFISRFCAGLLVWYDAVIHTDVDELLVADPDRFAGLAAYAGAMTQDVGTAIGLNVLQVPEEAALEPGRGVGVQRAYGWLSSAMCKPVLIRRPVAWSPGFHSTDAPISFGGLFLFHLRYADRAMALERLRCTRAMAWASDVHGAHQRVEDAAFAAMLDRLERMDRVEDAKFDPGAGRLGQWLGTVEASQEGRQTAMHKLDLSLDLFELWRIPDHLRAAF